MLYKPQVPREFRDDRQRQLEEEWRYERRYPDRKSDKAQGRNYRKELLERFADMELEDQELHGAQRYYE